MWRARPVFISSTFHDMQAERDHLRTHVFPELEERLSSRRHYLEWVDLRLGIATMSQPEEGARELQVLKVCLAEVRRCRPFLIVLLGDRYGWVPPPDRIEAAASEVGFSAEVAGRSVTDLEIDFGIFADPVQQQRSFFYFRAPLPYAEMPPGVAALYSDAHDNEPGAPTRTSRLAALKQRIERALPGRVRRYAAAWDGESQRVTGLESWGRMVLEDLWFELDQETKGAEVEPEIPWQQAERIALDDHLENCARDFVGRHDILERLTSLAIGSEGPTWGLCVTGDPGSGKSALFGELYRRLRDRDVFLLAHAPGASVQSASVNSMLRRWISELAAALGADDPNLPENAHHDTVHTVFAALVVRMTMQPRRVVMLIDALDQFESTTRAQFVTWLPRPWPENARLLVTAIAGTASAALAGGGGMKLLPLPPLDAVEARNIVKRICSRYHREFEPAVIDRLLATIGAAGPASGNPLWLTLAVEELNLLDADDFARARRYAGAPAEQLRALMLDEIASFPLDIPGLYSHTFDRAEELFGVRATRAILGLIAVSRLGWRESDFRMLLPRITGEDWDPLQFAYMRRLFRGQMRRHSVLCQWDFNHAQMRTAVLGRLGQEVSEKTFHAIIADHLLSCRQDDPLRHSDTMVHLLGSDDWARAAKWYGDSSRSDAEISGATRVLADLVVAQSSRKDVAAAQIVLNLIQAPDLHQSIRSGLAERIQYHVEPMIQWRVPTEIRALILDQTRNVFERLLRSEPRNTIWQRDLAFCCRAIGEALVAADRREEAVAAFRNGLAISKDLAAANPDSRLWQHDVAFTCNAIANVLLRSGRLHEALEHHRQSFAIYQQLCAAEPANVSWQRGLSVSHRMIGGVLAAADRPEEALTAYRECLAIDERLAAESGDPGIQRDLAVCHEGLGSVLMELGRSDEALEAYWQSLAIAEKLAAADPGHAGLQRDLAIIYGRMSELMVNAGRREDVSADYTAVGDALVLTGRREHVVEAHQKALAIHEKIAGADPGNLRPQRDLALSYSRFGEVLCTIGRHNQALGAFRKAMALVERLAAANPQDLSWQRNLSSIYEKLGAILAAAGERAAALEFCRKSLAIVNTLTAIGGGDAAWQRELSYSYDRIGHALVAAGQPEEGLEMYQKALSLRDNFGDN